jgi:WD40 repeat protein
MLRSFIVAVILLPGCAVPAPAWVAPPTGPRRDWQGDPLPRGAVARMGSARWEHAGQCRALAFTRRGDTLVSADDKAIRFWEVATGRELRSFPARVGCGGRLPLAPDGSFVVAAAGGAVVLHETATGRARWRIAWSEASSFCAAALSPDGRTLAIGRENGRVTLHETTAGTLRRELHEPTRQTGALAFSPDGTLLAVGDGPASPAHMPCWLRVYEVSTGKLRYRLKFHSPAVVDLTFLPGGQLGATGYSSGVLVWELPSGRTEMRYRKKGCRDFGNAVSPDGRLLATSGDQSVRLWERKTGRMVWETQADDNLNYFPTFSPDGSLLAIGGTYPGVVLIRVATGKVVYRPPGPRPGLLRLAVSPNGKVLATGSMTGEVFLWDMATGREQARLLGHRPGVGVLQLVFQTDGRSLTVVETEDGKGSDRDLVVRVLELPDGKDRFAPLRSREWWHPFALAPRGDLLARKEGNDVIVLDLRTGKPHRTLAGAGQGSVSTAFSPDGRRLAVPWLRDWPRREEVQLWDTQRGTIETTLPTGEICAGLGFSPDGRQLVHVDPFRSHLYIHELRRKGQLRKVPLRGAKQGNGSPPRFSPGGLWLARVGVTPTGDPFAQLFEVASGQLVLEIPDLRGGAYDVAFSPDGSRLVTDGWIPLVWDLPELAKVPAAALSPPPARGAHLWATLAGQDAADAFKALCWLARTPDEALPLLEKTLRPASTRDGQRIGKLLAQLDSDAFAERQAATRDLAALGVRAEPALRAAAQDGRLSLEVRRRAEKLVKALLHLPPATVDLREARALQVLEWIGSPRARRLLRKLAAGDSAAPLTEQARLALLRLERSLTAGR